MAISILLNLSQKDINNDIVPIVVLNIFPTINNCGIYRINKPTMSKIFNIERIFYWFFVIFIILKYLI
jgi:hypothetical protein